ncbi:MAG: hypothetical protein V1896_00140 [Candidatus Zambryskibacteria bacterium]
MNRIIPLILIISLFTAAFFGAALMVMEPNHNGGCIASEVEDIDCPTSIAAFTFHHISAFQAILASMVAPLSNLALLSLLLLALVLLFVFSKNLIRLNLNLLRPRVRDMEVNSSYGKQKIFSWLSLLEHSPSF